MILRRVWAERERVQRLLKVEAAAKMILRYFVVREIRIFLLFRE